MNLSVNSPRVLFFIVVSVILGLVAGAMFLSAPDQSRAMFERTGISDGVVQMAAKVADVTVATVGPMLSRAGINPTEAPATVDAVSKNGDAKTAPARPSAAKAPAPAGAAAPAAVVPAPADPPAESPEASSDAEQLPAPTPENAVPDQPAEATSAPFLFNPRVYTSEDEGVVPPRPLQPLLARDSQPGVDPASLALVEFVVDQRGEVEVVNLVRESGRVPDSMLLAAIKGWRFEPAMKDGQPVKFRRSVRVTY